MDCPKSFPSPLPPCCLSHCPLRNLHNPIRRGTGENKVSGASASEAQPVPDLFYTVVSAAKNESSPMYGASVQSINQQVFNGRILTVSVTDNPDDKGRGKRKLPHCALLAYKLYIIARHERTRLAREQAARLAEAQAAAKGRKPERIEPQNVTDALEAISLGEAAKSQTSKEQIERFLRLDIARRMKGKRRGKIPSPTPYAAIGQQVRSPRTWGAVSRQYVEQVAKEMGLNQDRKQGRVRG